MEDHIEIVTRLDKDLRKASGNLTTQEARYIVDTYYQLQASRIKANQQLTALEEDRATNCLSFVASQMTVVEKNAQIQLDVWTQNHPVGKWLRSIHGIGPVLAAGLLAHIDITKASTVGDIWAFAGLDPSRKWIKGQKRPWNSDLKRLCFLIGDSFMKHRSNEKCFYGHLYEERKKREWRYNLEGRYADQARISLETKKYREDSGAKAWYKGAYCSVQFSSPPKGVLADENNPGVLMLPPGRIELRARRWAVKLFLSHLHEIWYKYEYGVAPPNPFAFSILKHSEAHYISPPVF